MRYASLAANLILTTLLTACLFHIGFLNLRLSSLQRLNDSQSDLIDTYRDASYQLDECLENLRLNSAEMRSAIERSTAYCRG